MARRIDGRGWQRIARARWARLAFAVLLVAGLTFALLVEALPARAASCANMDAIRVPGAERQQAFCLDDLTTTSLVATGHTDMSDWLPLHASGTRNPSGVPGIQIEN